MVVVFGTKHGPSICDWEDYIHLKMVSPTWIGAKFKSHTAYLRQSGDRQLFAHRVILDAPLGSMVDHINGDGLDNRRSNLRIATPGENKRNSRKRTIGTSGFKGVYRHRTRWQARGHLECKVVYLGSFSTERDAALAYNEFAKKNYGEFALLNEV